MIPIMLTAPLTIVIPTSGATPYIDGLLGDLSRQTVAPAAVAVVVNNRRADVPSRPWHRRPGLEVTFLSRSYYFAKGVNIGLRSASTEYVAIANDDVRLPISWVEAIMEGFTCHPGYGSLASRVTSLRYPGRLDSCGDALHLCGRATNNGWQESSAMWTDVREVFSPSGCLGAYRRADVAAAGYLDDHFIAYMEDVDLGFRLQLLGRPCLFWPGAEAGHTGGATRRSSRFSARLTERNSVLTLVKNLPSTLWQQAFPEIVSAHVRPCSYEGHQSWLSWIFGKVGATTSFAYARRARRDIQATRRISDAHVASLLASGLPDTCHL